MAAFYGTGLAGSFQTKISGILLSRFTMSKGALSQLNNRSS